MGSKSPADCVLRDTVRLQARVLVQRFLRSLYLFALGLLPRRKTAAGGCSSGSAERAGAAVAGAAAPYPVFHCAAPVHPAKRASDPTQRAKRTADQEMAVAPYSPGIMREP